LREDKHIKIVKKGFILGIILLFIGAVVIPSMGGAVVEKTSSTALDFPGYIQDLIDNANDGDTIYIPSGTYYENIVIDKSINLIGEDKDTTIIDGGGNGDVIHISADGVTVSDFTIQNSGDTWDDAGIDISWSLYNIINSNIIRNNPYGICLLYTNNNIITGNNINSNQGSGIFLDDHSSKNSIMENIISSNGWGISLSLSSNNNIRGNNISFNMMDGIYSSNSRNVITGNNIISNYDDGIDLSSSPGNIITGNIISLNKQYGINVRSVSKENIISGNNITKNSVGGIYIYYLSYDNIIYHNNFIDNTQNAYDNYNNIWDDGYPSGGNYWDDYTGTDGDGDGIGDTPYPISGSDAEDRYPLMEPWSTTPPDTPIIDGPTRGRPGITYYYNFTIDDDDGDSLMLLIDWDDGTPQEWIGPFEPGQNITVEHSWEEKGTYVIRAIAKDIYGELAVGELMVTIPRNKATTYLWYQWFLGQFPLLERLLSLIRVI